MSDNNNSDNSWSLNDLISWFNTTPVEKVQKEYKDKALGGDSIDYDLIKDYLLKGSALGIGTALSLGLFKVLGGKRDLRSNSGEDDHIMYLRKKSSISEGLGITAGLTGAIISYLVGNKIINHIRKKQAQKALDDAQQQAYTTQGYDIVKNANNEDKGVLDKVTTGATALTTLLMLASGVATYSYLNAKYPLNKKQFEVNNPTTVKIIKNDNNVSYVSDDEDRALIERIKKQASCMEIPAFMLCSMYKKASQTADVVATIAQGNLDKFEKTVQDVGFFNAIDLVKGASTLPMDPVNEALSVLYCTKQASFSEPFNLLTAAEFGYFDTDTVHAVSKLTPQLMKRACDICETTSGSLHMAVLNDLDMPITKSASEDINEDIDYTDCKLNVEMLLNKRAESFLMCNNNCDTSSELSNGGTECTAKKEDSTLEEESESYEEAMEDDEEKAVKEDPIDMELEQSNAVDTQELAQLFD